MQLCFVSLAQSNGPTNNVNQSVSIKSSSGYSVDVNADGQLHTVQRGTIDVNNSTTDTLGIAGVFTGTGTDILDYGAIGVMVYTDQDGTLEAQFSPDNSTWYVGEEYDIVNGSTKFFTPPTQGAYFRLVYTNGAVAQTVFCICTTLKKQAIKWSSHNINDPITDQDDAVLMKGVVTGKDPDGVFRNANVTRDGDLTVSDNSSGLAISEGIVTGKDYIHKFGFAPDFDYGDGEVTIWDGADDAGLNQMDYVFSTSTAIDSISSSDAADTQQIKIQGLDDTYELVTQIATLSGQTRVALGTSLRRVFRLKNNNGTDLAGNVYVYENTALSGGVPTDTTKIRAIIQNGNNQTLMAVYSVPASKTAYMRSWYASTAGASKTSSYIIRLWAREYDETAGAHKAWQLKHITSVADGGTTYIQHEYTEPQKFPEKADIYMSVEATAAGATAAAFSAGFDIVLADD